MRNLTLKLPAAAGVALILLAAAGCTQTESEGASESCARNINGIDECSQQLAQQLEGAKTYSPPPAPEITGAPTCTPFDPGTPGGDGLMFIDITQSMAGFTSGTNYREFDYVMPYRVL